MVSSDRPVSLEDEVSHSMKEMIGGCCVCSDERGWAENPLVYCDGHGCSVAVHQGKHPTACLAEPGLLPTVTASPTLAATASSLSPLPRPAPFCGPGLTPRVRGGAQGVCVVHVGESACGLDCHVIRRSLSSVIWPPPAPGAVGLETFRSGGWRRGGAGTLGDVRGAGCAPLGRVMVAVGGFGHVEAPPPSCPLLSAAVCLGTSCGMESSSERNSLPSGEGGRVLGGKGSSCRFRLGREAPAAAPQACWRRPCCCGLGASCGEDGGKSPPPQSCCCRSGLAELPWAAG